MGGLVNFCCWQNAVECQIMRRIWATVWYIGILEGSWILCDAPGNYTKLNKNEVF
jgi:hypothetical protein